VVIASESGIGSGKRRIVAYAGQAALDHLHGRLQLLETIAERVGARNPDEVQARIDSMQQEIESLRKDLERRQRQHAHDSAASLVEHARQVGGVRVIAEQVEQANPQDLAGLVDALRQNLRSGVVVLGAVQDGRVNFAAGVTADLTDRVRAGDLVKEVAMEAGGGGGGQASFAKGSGTQPARIRAALDRAITFVERALLKV
jgi:alanyl-tRNA synthetase